jgi:hypothetical protein
MNVIEAIRARRAVRAYSPRAEVAECHPTCADPCHIDCLGGDPSVSTLARMDGSASAVRDRAHRVLHATYQ